MIVWLDHLIFGNGHGLKSPYWDDQYFWLKGEFYKFSPGFGAQLRSFQWLHPLPGERRKLCGQEFVVFCSRRRWIRVEVCWAMVDFPKNVDGMNTRLREFKAELCQL